jgi:hypothetical protein
MGLAQTSAAQPRPLKEHASEDFSMSELGRFLIIVGVILAVVGAVLWLAPKIPWLGRLPGDIVWQRGRWTFYFPFGTFILISVILTLLLYLFRR